MTPDQQRIWRAICGELYMMQKQIIKDRLHTPGTGKSE